MKKCMVCKNLGKNVAAECVDVIYHAHSEPSGIYLCYNHSVELFKTGQTNFVSKYKPYEIVSSDHSPTSVVNPLKNYFVFNSFR